MARTQNMDGHSSSPSAEGHPEEGADREERLGIGGPVTFLGLYRTVSQNEMKLWSFFAKIYISFIIRLYRTSIKSGHRGHSLILLQIKDDLVCICLHFQKSWIPFCRQKWSSRGTQRKPIKGYMRGVVSAYNFIKDLFPFVFLCLPILQSDAEFCAGKWKISPKIKSTQQ